MQVYLLAMKLRLFVGIHGRDDIHRPASRRRPVPQNCSQSELKSLIIRGEGSISRSSSLDLALGMQALVVVTANL